MYNNFNDSTTLIITLRRFDSLSILRSNFLRSFCNARIFIVRSFDIPRFNTLGSWFLLDHYLPEGEIRNNRNRKCD